MNQILSSPNTDSHWERNSGDPMEETTGMADIEKIERVYRYAQVNRGMKPIPI